MRGAHVLNMKNNKLKFDTLPIGVYKIVSAETSLVASLQSFTSFQTDLNIDLK